MNRGATRYQSETEGSGALVDLRERPKGRAKTKDPNGYYLTGHTCES